LVQRPPHNFLIFFTNSQPIRKAQNYSRSLFTFLE
jgi:hypothetical protein